MERERGEKKTHLCRGIVGRWRGGKWDGQRRKKMNKRWDRWALPSVKMVEHDESCKYRESPLCQLSVR